MTNVSTIWSECPVIGHYEALALDEAVRCWEQCHAGFEWLHFPNWSVWGLSPCSIALLLILGTLLSPFGARIHTARLWALAIGHTLLAVLPLFYALVGTIFAFHGIIDSSAVSICVKSGIVIALPLPLAAIVLASLFYCMLMIWAGFSVTLKFDPSNPPSPSGRDIDLAGSLLTDLGESEQAEFDITIVGGSMVASIMLNIIITLNLCRRGQPYFAYSNLLGAYMSAQLSRKELGLYTRALGAVAGRGGQPAHQPMLDLLQGDVICCWRQAMSLGLVSKSMMRRRSNGARSEGMVSLFVACLYCILLSSGLGFDLLLMVAMGAMSLYSIADGCGRHQEIAAAEAVAQHFAWCDEYTPGQTEVRTWYTTSTIAPQHLHARELYSKSRYIALLQAFRVMEALSIAVCASLCAESWPIIVVYLGGIPFACLRAWLAPYCYWGTCWWSILFWPSDVLWRGFISVTSWRVPDSPPFVVHYGAHLILCTVYLGCSLSADRSLGLTWSSSMPMVTRSLMVVLGVCAYVGVWPLTIYLHLRRAEWWSEDSCKIESLPRDLLDVDNRPIHFDGRPICPTDPAWPVLLPQFGVHRKYTDPPEGTPFKTAFLPEPSDLGLLALTDGPV